MAEQGGDLASVAEMAKRVNSGAFRALGKQLDRVEVTDSGLVHPAQSAPVDSESLPAEHGRGEGLVATLAVQHGIFCRAARITRWAALPVSTALPRRANADPEHTSISARKTRSSSKMPTGISTSSSWA
ncbi:hypothetical protein GCM10011579_033090 [Streptomyces albiflavescens]|uniref:Uncharacterized protein n=1 Tax=Streptomyces albiflavescens TaxID=1623582 RepID=A0A917Y1S9_9ACTN|nr:hypothetical protein GCM10011579_033090 [Streptomyces albiflavescens]